MNNSEANLCVVMLGTAARPEDAAELMRISSDCPYAAAYAAQGCLVAAVYVLPDSKRWWIEGIRERPELLGLVKITLVYTDYPDASSPWSRGEVQPVLAKPPCGSRCDQCPMYHQPCPGCPASLYCTAAGA